MRHSVLAMALAPGKGLGLHGDLRVQHRAHQTFDAVSDLNGEAFLAGNDDNGGRTI